MRAVACLLIYGGPRVSKNNLLSLILSFFLKPQLNHCEPTRLKTILDRCQPSCFSLFFFLGCETPIHHYDLGPKRLSRTVARLLKSLALSFLLSRSVFLSLLGGEFQTNTQEIVPSRPLPTYLW